MSKVVCIGVFDCLHVGHMRLLKEAALLGDVTVLLLSDHHAEEYKRLPVQDFRLRKKTLLELPWVDEVVMKDEPGLRPVEALRPKYLVIGTDYTQEKFFQMNDIGDPDTWLRKANITLVLVPNHRLEATSRIIARAKQR